MHSGRLCTTLSHVVSKFRRKTRRKIDTLFLADSDAALLWPVDESVGVTVKYPPPPPSLAISFYVICRAAAPLIGR